MSALLSHKVKESVTNGDIDGAIALINDAIRQGYPQSLINSWKRLVAKANGSIHPLELIPKIQFQQEELNCTLGDGLKKELIENLSTYLLKNKGDASNAANYAEIILKSIDTNEKSVLLPDLTSQAPESNLVVYKLDRYISDNPDVLHAFERGAILSPMDHLLRNGYLEIFDGKRRCSLVFSDKLNTQMPSILYIVDDISQLSETFISDLSETNSREIIHDIFSLHNQRVYVKGHEHQDLYHYLYEKISFEFNLCIMLPTRRLHSSALKWIQEIKLTDQTAIYGHGISNNVFDFSFEFSKVNALFSDLTKGCIIVNAIEVLSVAKNIPSCTTAIGFYRGLILALCQRGTRFILKNEILSSDLRSIANNFSELSNIYWSPFFDNTMPSVPVGGLRRDLLNIWKNHLRKPYITQSSADLGEWNENSNSMSFSFHQDSDFIIGIVIPFRDQIELLINCVNSLFTVKESLKFKVYAVNNDSVEKQTFLALENLKNKYGDAFECLNSPGAFNFSKINNYAASNVQEDFILFLNNDTVFESNYALSTLLQTHLFTNAIVTGSKLLYAGGKIQHNGLATTCHQHIAVLSPFRGSVNSDNMLLNDTSKYSSDWSYTHECTAVTAACMLVRKSDFNVVSGFDEVYSIAYNDVDLCFRLKNQFVDRPIVCCTDLHVIHLESESRGSDTINPQKQARLYSERNCLVDRHASIFETKDIHLPLDLQDDNIYFNVKAVICDGSSNKHSLPAALLDCSKLFTKKTFQGKKNKFAAIFVHYDKNNEISSDCIYYLEKLKVYCDIYFVSSSENLASCQDELNKIIPLSKYILVRRNSGYDFGCWSHVIQENYDDLRNYEGVILCNDSTWGPLNDFSDVFDKINMNKDYDFYGLTASTSPQWHLQSYFILYNQSVFSSALFKQHWSSISVYKDKFDIIMNYEVGWSWLLKRLGYKGIALYGEVTSAENPTHVSWENLLAYNYPFIKKELLRDNPLEINLSNLPEIISHYPENWSSHMLNYLNKYNKENSKIYKVLSDS